MDYRTVETPPFQVVGKALRVSTKDGENLRRIPQFWDECLQDGSHDQLTALSAEGVVMGDATLGVCTDFSADMTEFTYMIAAESLAGSVPDGMVEKSVPAATWAVFEAMGPLPEAIQTVWGRIWAEFFPTAPYQHADGPALELYPDGDPDQPGYRSEVWVPVTAV